MKYLITVMIGFLLTGSANAQHKITISGYLLDPSYQPLGGAEVIVFAPEPGRQGRKQVDAKGFYELQVDSGSPITIWYFHPVLGSVSIAKLSGKNNQDISKILPKDQKQLAASPDSMLEMIHSVEQLVLATMKNPDWARASFGSKEKVSFEQMTAAVKQMEDKHQQAFISSRLDFLRSGNFKPPR